MRILHIFISFILIIYIGVELFDYPQLILLLADLGIPKSMTIIILGSIGVFALSACIKNIYVYKNKKIIKCNIEIVAVLFLGLIYLSANLKGLDVDCGCYLPGSLPQLTYSSMHHDFILSMSIITITLLDSLLSLLEKNK